MVHVAPSGEDESGRGALPTPTVGAYFVERGWGSYTVAGPITKITDKLVYTKSPYRIRGAGQQHRKERVIFLGDEATCSRLVEQLRSSSALSNQEQQAARQRHTDRVQKLLERPR